MVDRRVGRCRDLPKTPQTDKPPQDHLPFASFLSIPPTVNSACPHLSKWPPLGKSNLIRIDPCEKAGEGLGLW